MAALWRVPSPQNEQYREGRPRMAAPTVPQRGLVADDELALTRQLRRVDISNGSRHRIFHASAHRVLELDRDQHLLHAADVARGGLESAVRMAASASFSRFRSAKDRLSIDLAAGNGGLCHPGQADREQRADNKYRVFIISSIQVD